MQHIAAVGLRVMILRIFLGHKNNMSFNQFYSRIKTERDTQIKTSEKTNIHMAY